MCRHIINIQPRKFNNFLPFSKIMIQKSNKCICFIMNRTSFATYCYIRFTFIANSDALLITIYMKIINSLVPKNFFHILFNPRKNRGQKTSTSSRHKDSDYYCYSSFLYRSFITFRSYEHKRECSVFFETSE